MALDRKGLRERWLMARGAESQFNSRLRQVAKQVDAIVRGLAPDGEISDRGALFDALAAYSELIGPWAKSVARYMVADVSRRNLRAWQEIGNDMSRALRAEIAHAPTGMLNAALMDEQVTLIKSLPLKAAKRIHDLTDSALTTSTRAETIAKDILATGRVTEARARLIARTEVSRTAANLTQARAMFAGSEGYVWRTSQDSDVRPTHQELEGVYVRWDSPPRLSSAPTVEAASLPPKGNAMAPYHAGCGPNCRCYPDPVLPDL